MRYTRVVVHLDNGKDVELSFVMVVPSPDDEYRFQGQHYDTKFTFVKRNVAYIEMVK